MIKKLWRIIVLTYIKMFFLKILIKKNNIILMLVNFNNTKQRFREPSYQKSI